MSSTKKTIFITGGRGFIGRNILEYYTDQYNILAPNHNELELLSQNEVDLFFKKNEIDYVIHCANVGGSRKSNNIKDVVENNLRMFFNISKNSENCEKIINLGSGACYDKNNMKPHVKETDVGIHIPIDDYGFSKYIISKYIDNIPENIYCLNLFGIFGPYEDYEFKFISNSIVKNILKLPITIIQNVNFDWLYIDDFLKFLDYFLQNKLYSKNYNICSGKTTDLISIAKIVNQVSSFKSDIIIKNNGLNKEYSGNNNKIMNEIGEFSFTDMKSAIEKLYDYYNKNLHTINQQTVFNDPYIDNCKINKC